MPELRTIRIEVRVWDDHTTVTMEGGISGTLGKGRLPRFAEEAASRMVRDKERVREFKGTTWLEAGQDALVWSRDE